jgi:peptidyl-prolyl cis-trans isomerase C
MSKRNLQWILAGMLAICMAGCEPGGDTLAEVNGQSVTKREFDTYLKFKRLNAEDENRRAALLDQYLERAALASAIEDAIEESETIDAALLEAELAEFRKEMLISRYFEQYLADKVSDEAVANYYNGHPDEFEQEQARVAHILFRTNRNMGEEERQVKLTAAQEAHSKITSGTDFAQVAKNFSEDQISGKKGGDLGWLKVGSIDATFSETVFSMEPGAVSTPIETPFGFHIVKLLEGPVVAKRPLDAVKGDIRYRLRNEAKDAELQRLVSEVEIEKE